MSQINEKERVANYYNWENHVKEVCKQIEGIPTKDRPLKEIAKALSSVVDYVEKVQKSEVINEFEATIPINGKDAAMPFKKLYSFVLRKSLAEDNVGFGFHHIKISKCGENPYAHPLAKSLGISPVDKDFFVNNELLTPEAYEKLKAGTPTEAGLWNTTFEKALPEKENFEKVRKLIHRNEKTYIATYYARSIEGGTEENINLEKAENLHGLALFMM